MERLMPNMTPEELRQKIYTISLTPVRDINDGVVNPPGSVGLSGVKIQELIQLFADLCGEVIPDKILTVSTCYSDGFNAAIDLSAARFAKLTGKEMNQ
jgi:hypothetical protein